MYMHEMAFDGQAFNGILQSAPPIFFTLVAGPLSDRYGRKPLILISFFGQILLGVVFLVNTFWFEELKVEYLLFECLQVIRILRSEIFDQPFPWAGLDGR